MKYKYKILFIEDDDFLVSMYLKKWEKDPEIQVDVAFTGEEGVSLLKKNKYDFVLIDILLPDMDGIDILKMMKQDENLKDIPVFMLTNLTTKKSINKSLKLGCDGYLVKAHFTPTEVIHKIKNILYARANR